MHFSRLFQSFVARRRLSGRHRRRSWQDFCRTAECLELRELLTTYTVTSQTDNVGELDSLRAMINNANLNGNPGDVIAFASNVKTITVNPAIGPLPAILVPVTMDGGIDGVSIIGTSLGGSNTGLYFNASGNHVSHLAIYGFGGTQIIFASNSNVVQSNFIGTNLSQAFKGGQIGVAFNGASNDISNNVISGLTGGYSAIYLTGAGANKNKVYNNFIGTKNDGSTPLPNAGTGLSILAGASSNEVWNNVISANTVDGIDIGGVGTMQNLIEGNYVGTNKTGEVGGTALSNLRDGVEIFGGASQNTIGGAISSVGQQSGGNVISNNAQEGVDIYDTDANLTQHNLVEGNFIGTDKAGTKVLPNQLDGVLLCLSAAYNTIGGTDLAHSNVISGNIKAGIRIGDEDGGVGESPANHNFVQDNFIGTNSGKTLNLGNGTYGIYINGNNNVIGAPYGSTNQALGNWIAFSGQKDAMKGNGIAVAVDPKAAGGPSSTGQQNTIRLNHIYMNERLGIDLNDDYVDIYSGKTNSAANPLANNGASHPTITSVNGNTVTWMLNAPLAGTYVVDIYSDPLNTYTDYAEGQTFLESVIPVKQNGHFEFTTTVGSDTITAIATDSNGNSSEFSLADKAGDGLCDTWKANGYISLHGNPGEEDVMLPGGSVNHKDLYVEYDSMTGWGPQGGALGSGNVLDAVVTAFANAPKGSVHNPDGTAGISLHLVAGNQNIAPQAFGADSSDITTWSNFQAVKAANFASGSKPGTDKYNAALLAYRYCVFGTTYENTGSSGFAEVIGNDFMVTLGGWFADKTGHTLTTAAAYANPANLKSAFTQQTIASTQAGTFMHELGHTLGIDHSGPVNWNGSQPATNWNGTVIPAEANWSPAYTSVMNYLYQFDRPATKTRPASNGILDYSEPNSSGTSPDEWGHLWFAFQESSQSPRGSDTSTASSDDTADVSPYSPNHAPVGVAKTVTTLEDTPYVFKVADFGFSDPIDFPQNSLLAVKIMTLPLAGSLADNGVAVMAGAHISAADITAGKLKFTPVTNKNGAAYASFTFQVQDNGGTANGGIDTDPTPRKMTVNVTHVTQAPVGTAKTVTTLENTAYKFVLADFGFTDPHNAPANTFTAVKITTLPAAGTLKDNGVTVTAGQLVSVADISAGKLLFTPANFANGAAYSKFTFQVEDNGSTANGGVNLDPTPKTMTINVTHVNLTPFGAAKTVTMAKNTAYAFKVTDFGFTDPHDTPANTLLSVKISSLTDFNPRIASKATFALNAPSNIRRCRGIVLVP